MLNDVTGQVVVSRRDAGVRKWTHWLREDLGSRPHAWLRPYFVPPPPFLMVKDPQSQVSRNLVEPHLIDAEVRKAWLPFFCRCGHPVVTVDQFFGRKRGGLLVIFCLSSLSLIFLRIIGRDLQEVVDGCS